MAYLINTKAQGKKYFYVAQYVGEQDFTEKKYKHIYAIGNETLAFERLSLWLLDNSFIPKELIEVGIQISDIEDWKERVKNTINVH